MRSNKQFVIILAILLVALAISVPSYLIVPASKEDVLVSKLPMNIGDWQGKDLPVEEVAYQILETRNLILREYTRGQDTVYLYIVYSQDNRKVSHPPEVCFEGSGITIVKKEPIVLEVSGNKEVFANKLTVEKAGVTNLVVYWYKAGNYYIDNYLKQQLRIALSRLQLKHTSGALIRISAEVDASHPDKALEDIRVFARDVSAYFGQVIP
ncbi:MAG: EpsI family protein [Candidatus Omnitrophica bacterium]|nr:EpsI family protein [Candidatus Omnitrophota bacterium]